MAFVKVSKSAVGSKFSVPEIRMGSHLQSNKVNRGIYFSISASVVEQAKWILVGTDSGTREKANIDVLEGTGDDAGFLMLVQTSDGTGYSVGREKSKGMSVAFAVSYARMKHYVLNELPIEPHSVNFTIEADNSILIECPDWLRYNPLSVKEEAPPSPPPPTATVHDMRLNRQERRAIGKRVASRLK